MHLRIANITLLAVVAVSIYAAEHRAFVYKTDDDNRCTSYVKKSSIALFEKACCKKTAIGTYHYKALIRNERGVWHYVYDGQAQNIFHDLRDQYEYQLQILATAAPDNNAL